MYLKHVDKAHEVSLPLLSKIIDNTLVLKDYTLDKGHLGGLAKVFDSGQLPLYAALFDNCGIDDEELAILLESLTNL